jgi:signal peptide peptidase SppA
MNGNARTMMPTDTVLAIDEASLQPLLAQATPERIEAALRLAEPDDRVLPLEVVEGVGVVSITGPMARRPSLWSLLYGGSTYEMIEAAVERAVERDDVRAILLRIDSPGGAVSGLREAGEAIAAAAVVKPTAAHVDDLAASAAYYLASQASEVHATPMSQIGSIGTLSILYDTSAMFAARGIRPVVITTGEHKATGYPGVPITESNVEARQQIVDAFFADFVAAVARGRGMADDAVLDHADGRVLMANVAAEHGLIDGVATEAEVIAGLLARADQGERSPEQPSPPNPTAEADDAAVAHTTEPPNMSTENTTAPATIADLRANMPSAPSEFLLSCLERGHTLTEALQANTERLEAANADLAAQVEAQPKPGADPLDMTGGGDDANASTSGSAVDEWNERLSAAMAKPGATRASAVRSVVKGDPDLHRRMLADVNDGRDPID